MTRFEQLRALFRRLEVLERELRENESMIKRVEHRSGGLRAGIAELRRGLEELVGR